VAVTLEVVEARCWSRRPSGRHWLCPGTAVECGDDMAASMTAAVSLAAATALPLDRLGFRIIGGAAAER
jgi:hypothetical protein